MYSLFVLCMLAVAATAQTTARSTLTIIDYLTAQHRTNLLNLIQQAGLTDTLKGSGPYTLFAPPDRYLGKLDTSDKAKLAAFLKYHVANGQYKRAGFYNEMSLTTLQPSSELRVNVYLLEKIITVEGVIVEAPSVLSAEEVLSNGIVHFIRGHMTPPTGTVLDVVSKETNLTTLASVIKSASLENFFQDQKPITLFAPTDAAFNKLGSATVQALVADPALLKSVLQYHVVPGTLYRESFHYIHLHTFEEADQIVLRQGFFSGDEADNGSILGDELSATNGVVHAIDEVLIPSSLSGQVKALTAGTTTAV